MTSVTSFLIFCQALGATIGAFTAIWSEIAYIRAMRDRKIDVAERKHLEVIAQGLRYGLTLLLLSSLGLVIAAYLSALSPQPALTAEYWIGSIFAVLILATVWARSEKHMSFPLSSAIVFTGWWFLTYVTYGNLTIESFGSTIALFVIAAAIMYALLHYMRFFASHLAQRAKN